LPSHPRPAGTERSRPSISRRTAPFTGCKPPAR
jgi:hypothetical protein